MKLFSKIAVLAAAVMLVSVFAGCKNNEDEGAGVLAEYVQKDSDFEGTITFFDDDTFEANMTGIESGIEMEVYATGTYKGDISKDETLTYDVEALEVNGMDYMSMFAMEGASTKGKFTISKDRKTLTCETKGPFMGTYTLKK